MIHRCFDLHLIFNCHPVLGIELKCLCNKGSSTVTRVKKEFRFYFLPFLLPKGPQKEFPFPMMLSFMYLISFPASSDFCWGPHREGRSSCIDSDFPFVPLDFFNTLVIPSHHTPSCKWKNTFIKLTLCLHSKWPLGNVPADYFVHRDTILRARRTRPSSAEMAGRMRIETLFTT